MGVDYTSAMLARAREQVERRGWENVELIQDDATQIDLGRTFAAALCTLAISVIPNDRLALDRMVMHVKAGGWLAIADARRSSRWYGRPLNWLADALGYGAAADTTRKPWELMQNLVTDFHCRDWAWRFFYVAAGRVPNI